MKGGGRLVKCISGFQKATWLAVDCKFVRPLDHVAKRIVARVPMRSATRPRLSIQKADAHFSPWEIGERLSKELPRGWRGGLRRRALAPTAR